MGTIQMSLKDGLLFVLRGLEDNKAAEPAQALLKDLVDQIPDEEM